MDVKKVLILTSYKTGSGHKSSSNAIEKKLNDAGYDTRQVDIFPLMGKTGNLAEESYIPITTRTPYLFYATEKFSDIAPSVIHTTVYQKLKNSLLAEINSYNPDLIISVQVIATKAVSKILKENNLNIPFYVGVIDLINPPKMWMDKNADMTFVPTEEIRKYYIENGFAQDKVLVSGFPVRDDIILRNTPKEINNRVHILMVNTSTNLKKNIRFVQEVSRLENITIYFICGLDKRLYRTLCEMKFNGEIDNIEIYDFVNNMNEFLAHAHIILTKAGPNVITESIRSDTAIVVTGHIKGQENHNYEYVVDNGYGLKCEDPDEIYDVLYDFINTDKLKTCLDNIVRHEIGNGAEFIAEYVHNNI